VTSRNSIKVLLLVAILSLCLFQLILHREYSTFRAIEATFLSLRWMLLACIVVWFSIFLFLTFSLKDLCLVGLMANAIVASFISHTISLLEADAIVFLVSLTLGKGACILFSDRIASCPNSKYAASSHTAKIIRRNNHFTCFGRRNTTVLFWFFTALIGLLTFSSLWHMDMSENSYRGPRWMGLWSNPNIYGMLMGTGVVLAIGLFAERGKTEGQDLEAWERNLEEFDALKAESKVLKLVTVFLLVATGIMGLGLVCSYSRGAWVGTGVGLLYLAWSYGKMKWRHVLPGLLIVMAVGFCFWGATPDTAPWYVKRADLGRPSAQHRVAAWRGALQMMRDHPFGVGWNKAVQVYQSDYSPPEGGAPAITTNDYLMLGTQLGWPGLACFVGYVALCFRGPKPKVLNLKSGNCATMDISHSTLDPFQTACRAGALSMLVAFWFDAGLFILATASVFWVLLELGKGG
jgi:hypothetical protein